MKLQNRSSCGGCMAFIGGECALGFPIARIRPKDIQSGYKPSNKCYKPKSQSEFQKSYELTV